MRVKPVCVSVTWVRSPVGLELPGDGLHRDRRVAAPVRPADNETLVGDDVEDVHGSAPDLLSIHLVLPTELVAAAHAWLHYRGRGAHPLPQRFRLGKRAEHSLARRVDGHREPDLGMRIGKIGTQHLAVPGRVRHQVAERESPPVIDQFFWARLVEGAAEFMLHRHLRRGAVFGLFRRERDRHMAWHAEHGPLEREALVGCERRDFPVRVAFTRSANGVTPPKPERAANPGLNVGVLGKPPLQFALVSEGREDARGGRWYGKSEFVRPTGSHAFSSTYRLRSCIRAVQNTR